MTSAIDKDESNFESAQYRPEITFGSYAFTLDPSQMETYMKSDLVFRTRAFNQMDPHQSIYEIDGAIRVKIPSDTFRHEKVKHWKSEHATTKQWAWIEGGAVALCATGAVFSSPYLAVALGVASFASLILSVNNTYKTAEATRQIEGWKASPLHKLAKERAKAYEKENGFSYVYNNIATRAVLVPSEVHFLYDRHFNTFCDDLLRQTHPATPQGKKKWLDAFTHLNPVSEKVLSYAHDGFMPVPEKYNRVSYDYEVLHAQLTDLRSEFDKLRDQRRNETTDIIRQINHYKELALLPFHGMLLYWEGQARDERDSKLRRASTPEEISEINDKYYYDISKYHSYHLAAIIPVNIYYDGQISQAHASLKNILEEITKNEASSHAPYFNYARGLLDYAWQVKQVPNYEYPPQAFTPDVVFNIPKPSAPPLEELNFVEAALQQKPEGVDYVEYIKFISVKSTKLSS